jgi:excisionase family DNA binding protein
MEKLYYTVKEIAEMFGVTEQTVHNWGKKGKIVAVKSKLSRRKHYKKEDIDNLLEELKGMYKWKSMNQY